MNLAVLSNNHKNKLDFNFCVMCQVTRAPAATSFLS